MRNLATRITNLTFVTILFIASLSSFSVLPNKKVSAVQGSDFNAARIIDDSVFFNPNTMSSQEIQNFLNTKVPVCDTNGTQAYGGTTRAAYGTSRGYPPPYTCLKDYAITTPAMPSDQYCSGGILAGSKSAATIIKEVSAACSINPQVLLILLQKEQSLVTDDWPWTVQYTKATGYGCPDSALSTDVDQNQNGCYDEYEGFFNQVYYGARQYQRYAKQPQLFNYRAGQTANIYYNPNPSCGYSAVTIETQATAGLYNYTPYQPNAATLSANPGQEVPCGAYGNINFWRQFWNWFGNPIGSPYAWLIENFIYANGDNILTQGQPEKLILTARNVGRFPWYNSGNNPVRLGSWQPLNRASPLLNGGNRFATLKEAVVQPNEIGTFEFTVTPGANGTFVEPMNLVAENSQWMSWPGFSPTVTITPNPYQWQVERVVYGNGTGNMDPGTVQDMTLFVRNTGNITWSKSSGPQVWLGTWQPNRESAVAYQAGGKWPNNTRVTQMNDSDVPPGASTAFQFKVRVPASGNFYERLNLVAEGQAWFNDPGLILYLHGSSYAWQPLWTSVSTSNYSIPRNTTFTITIKVKNIGEMTWKKAGGSPVRLGTSAPLNRGSGLQSSSWLNDIRPTGLVEDTVAPNQEGTFTFIAKTPATPGVRYEGFNLVAEGTAWFIDPGYYININVL